MKTFETTMSLKFRQTDMAGIGYFNEAFNLFHDSYEEWARELCGSKTKWFANPEWAVPIKKIEAEYFLPLFAFETYTVRLSVSSVGTSSFTLKTEILGGDRLHCEILSTHVFMDKSTRKSTAIPESIAAAMRA